MKKQLIDIVLQAIKDKVTGDEQALVKEALGEYEELFDRNTFLGCLEACGVDNWQGFPDAYELYDQLKEAE